MANYQVSVMRYWLIGTIYWHCARAKLALAHWNAHVTISTVTFLDLTNQLYATRSCTVRIKQPAGKESKILANAFVICQQFPKNNYNLVDADYQISQ
jgi:hypothetical protein